MFFIIKELKDENDGLSRELENIEIQKAGILEL